MNQSENNTFIHKERNVVVVGLINDDGNILMVRTRRFPEHWQPIGGGMEKGEEPLESIKREVLEEVEINLNEEDFKHHITTNYDFGIGNVYFYTALVPNNLELSYNSEELVEWRWMTPNEVSGLQMFPATQKFIQHLLNKKDVEIGFQR